MSTTIEDYQKTTRELDKIERAYNNGETDSPTLNEARQKHHEATKAWEEERGTLTTQTLVKTALQSANAKTPSPLTETEHIKQRIKECRKALREARAANKALYAQLAANRETKLQLNEDYDELRQRKKQLESVNP